ncbi:MAG: helix-turn-helix domain-containing protein [Candidatus Thioglobus autotrophicus]|nr:helix-turn-helix domain-containing protein [Candidatus Thioglobus autotrophicus]
MLQVTDMLLPIIERLDRLEYLIVKSKNTTPKLMTVKDVAEYSSLSEITVRRGVMKGTLKPFKEDGKKLFRRTDVDKWLKG